MINELYIILIKIEEKMMIIELFLIIIKIENNFKNILINCYNIKI